MSLKIKAKIVENGLRQGEVAKRLGITEATLSRKLNGHAEFNLGEVEQILEILKETGIEMTVDELVYG